MFKLKELLTFMLAWHTYIIDANHLAIKITWGVI